MSPMNEKAREGKKRADHREHVRDHGRHHHRDHHSERNKDHRDRSRLKSTTQEHKQKDMNHRDRDIERNKDHRERSRLRSTAQEHIQKDMKEHSVLCLKLAGFDIEWEGCSNAFFAIEGPMKLGQQALWHNLVRSNKVEKSRHPVWDTVEVNMDLICQRNLDKPIRICIYDVKDKKEHNPIGSVVTSVHKLLERKADKVNGEYKIDRKLYLDHEGREMGEIAVLKAHIYTPPLTSKSVCGNSWDGPKTNSAVRFTLEAHSLAPMNGLFGFGKADAFWQAETPLETPDGAIVWQVVHRSEYVLDSLDPKWKPASIHLDLLCQMNPNKPIKFSFFDWEDSRIHQPMGSFLTTANRLLRSAQPENKDVSQAFVIQCEDREGEFGHVFVAKVELFQDDAVSLLDPKQLNISSLLVLSLEGVAMVSMNGLFGASDPFFVVETPVLYPDGIHWQTFEGSEVIMDHLNPSWRPMSLNLQNLCGRDIDKPIRISLWDWEKSGKHQEMGHCICSVRRLLHSKAAKNSESGETWDMTKALPCLDDKGYEFGHLVVTDIQIK